jgi:hypothetical protein
MSAAPALGHRLGLLSDCARQQPARPLFGEFQRWTLMPGRRALMPGRRGLKVLQRLRIIAIERFHEQAQHGDAPLEFGRRQQHCLNIAR